MSKKKRNHTKKNAASSTPDKRTLETKGPTAMDILPEQISEKEKYLTASQRISDADAEQLKQNADAEEKSYEDALEQHYMHFGKKLKYKFHQYREKTSGMSFGAHLKFFFYYYKWNVIIIAALILCGVTLGKDIYINSRPMAIGLAILNNKSEEDDQLSELIEKEYRRYYDDIKLSDRFFILDKLAIDPETYTSEIMATSSTTLTSYENLYYHITSGSIDVIITDKKGLLYCIEQDLVYPIENFFDADITALYDDDIKVFTSYTGEEREYAVDISKSRFASELNLGYSEVYLLFPSNAEENKARAAQFIAYIYGN